MADSRDLLTLMYRSDWSRWCISAQVSIRRDARAIERLSRRASADLRRDTGGIWPPAVSRPGHRPGTDLAAEPRRAEIVQRIIIAPGGRYRFEPIADEAGDSGHRRPGRDQSDGADDDDETVSLIVCDGESCWVIWGTGPDAEASRCDADPAWTPMRDVVRPAILMSRFQLTAQDLTQIGGRAAYRVLATPRQPIDRLMTRSYSLLDRLDLLVDAELGIVLRREAFFDGQSLGVAELRDFTVDPPAAADAATFRPPPGIEVEDEGAFTADFGPYRHGWATDPGPDEPSIGAGGIAASLAATAAGIAARRAARPEPPRYAGPDPEPAMPEPDEPPADARPASHPVDARWASHPAADASGQHEAISGELLNLIARTQLPALNLTAQVHSWYDFKAVTKSRGLGSPDRQPFQLLAPGFLGGGSLWPEFHRSHRAALLHVAMPGRYKISYDLDERPRQPLAVACDGDRLRKVFHNRVVTSPAEPLSAEFAGLVDPAWLLSGWQLTAAGETTAGGRAALRVIAVPPRPRRRLSADQPASQPLRIEALIDAELGILLRQLTYVDDRPAVRFELRDVVVHDDGQARDTGQPGDFSVDIPPGAQVISSDGGPLHDLDLAAPLRAAAAATGPVLADAASRIGRLSDAVRRLRTGHHP